MLTHLHAHSHRRRLLPLQTTHPPILHPTTKQGRPAHKVSSSSRSTRDSSSANNCSSSSSLRLLEGMEARYQPPWPLGLVLPPPTLARYASIHRLLLRLHWLAHQAQRSREKVRAAAKCHAQRQRDKGASSSSSLDLPLRTAHALLHRLAALAALLLQHVALQVEGDCWGRLKGVLKRAVHSDGEGMRVDGLRDAHAAYVEEVAARCFLALPYTTGGAGPAVQRTVGDLGSCIEEGCALLEDGAMGALLLLTSSSSSVALQEEEEEEAAARGLRSRLALVRNRLNVLVPRLLGQVRRHRLEAPGVVRRGSGYADALVDGLHEAWAAEERCAGRGEGLLGAVP